VDPVAFEEACATLAADEQQARRSRPLLLAEGSSVSVSTGRPLAAELDESEQWATHYAGGAPLLRFGA
jgi:hypothetical protein